MSEHEWVERFTVDVDRLVKAGTVADSAEGTSAEYSELLRLAQALSSTDFSDQSQIQPVLRRRLLDMRQGWHPQERIPMLASFRKLRLALVLPTVMLVSLLIAGLTWPGGLTAAAQDVIDFVQRLWVGEHTSIEPIDLEQIEWNVEPSKAACSTQVQNCTPEPGKCKIVRLDDRLLSGNGVSRHFDSIAEAQAAISFTLRQPAALPEGYTFSQANVWGLGDLATTDLLYSGPDSHIMLSQSPVSGQRDQGVAIGLPGVTAIATVQVNGHTATWAEHTLIWEADGISYLLTGSNLGQEDALHIAESIE